MLKPCPLPAICDICQMKVVITSATQKETEQLKEAVEGVALQALPRLVVTFHHSGVGMLPSCFSILSLINEEKPDLIIQTGIAGCFKQDIPLGTVVTVKDEYLGDTGVEEYGEFKDLFDLNLQNDSFPFQTKSLSNIHLPGLNYLQLKEVAAVTINEITTRRERIEQLKRKYQPAIESMEGASVHYCCLSKKIPFLQVRAVSNYIGERDKTKWNFRDSLGNLSNAIVEYLVQLEKNQKN
jgi:futalosine hydrolase